MRGGLKYGGRNVRAGRGASVSRGGRGGYSSVRGGRGGTISVRGGRGGFGGGRRKQPKIELPVDTKLSKPLFVNLKHIFVVDLSSYTGLACSELLHQLLFGEILKVADVKVIVVMKAKFAPRCQCGIGERNVDTSFYKNRFIVESDGRIVLEPEKTVSSKRYRDELVKYLCSIVSDPEMVHVHSEDYIDASCKVYSLITPASETTKLLANFKIGFQFKSAEQLEQLQQEQTVDSSASVTSTASLSTPSKSKFGKKNGGSSASTPLKKKVQLVHSNSSEGHGRVGIVGTDADVDVVAERVKAWLTKRLSKDEDIVNLPKTRASLETAIKSFCTIYKESDIQAILSILFDSGDINLCMVCQSCRPTNPNSTSFYYTHKRVPEYLLDHCHSMMAMVNTLYTKNKEQPIPLNTLTASAFKDRVFVSEQAVVNKLLQSEFIKIVDKANRNSNSDNNDLRSSINSNSSYSYGYGGYSSYGGYDQSLQQQQNPSKQRLEYTEIAIRAEKKLDSFLDILANLVVNEKDDIVNVEKSTTLAVSIAEPEKEVKVLEAVESKPWDTNLSVTNSKSPTSTPTSTPSKYKYFKPTTPTPKKDFSFF